MALENTSIEAFRKLGTGTVGTGTEDFSLIRITLEILEKENFTTRTVLTVTRPSTKSIQ